MEDLIIPIWALAALFAAVAFAYSTVGLGGGSSYTALMAILGVGHIVIPTISLSLNLLVTLIGSVTYIRHGHARLRLILPFLVASIPMAYLGGSLDIPKLGFYWILLISLVFVAARIYLWTDTAVRLDLGRTGQLLLSLLVGAVLGLVAGIVGIGGGIYLVPLIIILRLGTAKEAAACGAIFIWINSLSGLIARVQHHQVDLLGFLPLVAAVVIGGSLGSHIGASRLKPRMTEKWLGVVILIAIVILADKIAGPGWRAALFELVR